MKRVKHMIKAVRLISQIIIYTDYSTIINIIKQIKLAFHSIDKLNFHLIKVFTYLFQFVFDIRYKLSK